MLNYKDETILVIGKGTTNYKVNTINEVPNEYEAKKYGEDSQLYNAFMDSLDFSVSNSIFMINMKYDTDYPKIINSITHSDFTYIVPLNIKFSDLIYIEDENRKIFYAEYLLNSIKDSNLSTIFMTDNHAHYYEDIDHFVKSMESVIRTFKGTSVAINNYGRNLCFVANNLADYDYANLIAVYMLASSQYKDYPLQDCGNAVFDIDTHDVHVRELSFFKYNIKRSATIDNFHNFNVRADQGKCVTIDRVIKYLQRYLDLSEFCGKFYNAYIKSVVLERLNTLLAAVKNVAIADYKVLSCDFVKNTQTRTVVILNEIEITPINSIEKYKLFIEV